MTLGTPPQSFKIMLDTTSADLWVAGTSCKSIGCFLHPKYNSSVSSTYKRNGTEFSATSNEKSISGFMSRDMFSVGDMSIKDQLFAQLTKNSDLSYETVEYDGILGLAFDAISANRAPSPMYNMIKNGLIKAPVVSLYLTDKSHESQAVFGGIDQSHYKGETHYVPVAQKDYWRVPLASFALENSITKLEKTSVAINTGTSLFTLPTKIADVLNTQIGATKDFGGRYTVNCRIVQRLPDFTLHIGGKPYRLKSTEYIFYSDGICFSPFVPLDFDIPGSSLWTVGDVFLRKYFTVLDLGQAAVGFAEAA